jgi:hypothetical protein
MYWHSSDAGLRASRWVGCTHYYYWDMDTFNYVVTGLKILHLIL